MTTKSKRPGARVLASEKVDIVEFTVTGRLLFPLDMLRYDRCWPASSEDVASMHDAASPVGPVRQRTVRLQSVGYSSPTIARWESFGWHVVDPTVTT